MPEVRTYVSVRFGFDSVWFVSVSVRFGFGFGSILFSVSVPFGVQPPSAIDWNVNRCPVLLLFLLIFQRKSKRCPEIAMEGNSDASIYEK